MENLNITLGYPSTLLQETLVDQLYADFSPETGNFFEEASKLVKISRELFFGLSVKDVNDLLADNAYFITSHPNNPTYEIGNFE